jgi:hypothetical protein
MYNFDMKEVALIIMAILAIKGGWNLIDEILG